MCVVKFSSPVSSGTAGSSGSGKQQEQQANDPQVAAVSLTVRRQSSVLVTKSNAPNSPLLSVLQTDRPQVAGTWRVGGT